MLLQRNMFHDQAGRAHYSSETKQCHSQDIQETRIAGDQEVVVRAAGAQPGPRDVENLPVGTQALNQCGEYYHIAHNHALHQITAWGVVLSGHITFARIDPPLPNLCTP